MANSAGVSILETLKADFILSKLDILMRGKSLDKAMRKAAKVVEKEAKRLCPVDKSQDVTFTNPDGTKLRTRVGKKSGKKHLRDTIGMVSRQYRSSWVVVIGPQYPAGAHGHLIEFGHNEVLFGVRTGRRVPPKPFLRPAADTTIAAQQAAFEGELQRQVAQAVASG